MRVAVVGHVEWVEFAPVERLPAPGDIVDAPAPWQRAAGGGAVAAVQLARLAGECLFCTALGDDELGHTAESELEEMGVRVVAAWRRRPQRRAFVMLDANGERTIVTLGKRLEPRGDDPLAWEELRECDAVYVTAGDGGAVRAARGARRLVATPRAISGLSGAGVEIDVLVCSSADSGEHYRDGDLDPPPRIVARTAGAAGGALSWADGRTRHWDPAPLPGPPKDAYGAGDSFAGGLTYGLAEGRSPEQAVELGARCGAACMTGRGPYERQLRSAD